PRVQLAAQLHGGGQERGMRSGTLYPPQIVGFAKAVELGLAELEAEAERLIGLRDRLWQALSQLPDITLNGHPIWRLPGNLNVSIDGVDGSALLLGLRTTVALSSGAACSTTKTEPSHVLKALGHRDELAYASLRFGLGRWTTAAEIDRVAEAAIATIQSLRQASGYRPVASSLLRS
ncbi:MAG: aminotransferase class V-fold PLP-dependent enzyme, partial [Cyanobacteria bacterium P01_C01_bin.73]